MVCFLEIRVVMEKDTDDLDFEETDHGQQTWKYLRIVNMLIVQKLKSHLLQGRAYHLATKEIETILNHLRMVNISGLRYNT